MSKKKLIYLYQNGSNVVYTDKNYFKDFRILLHMYNPNKSRILFAVPVVHPAILFSAGIQNEPIIHRKVATQVSEEIQKRLFK